MRPLCLEMIAPPPRRLDLSPLTPDRLAGASLGEIERMTLACGKEDIAVAELFRVSGEDSQDIEFTETTDRCDHIGAGMTRGRISVNGDCGDFLGFDMRGGNIEARGQVGDYAASKMKSGELRILGDAGAFLGGAPAGERRGMAGGLVIVAGSVGDRSGDFMRRGTILIEGAAGEYCASRMLAGTIAVLGPVGSRAGYGLRRGSLMLTREPAQVLPTFVDCGEHDFGFLRLMKRAWLASGSRFAELEPGRNRARRFVGDGAAGGVGEILVLK